jgi:hypothetical protein
VKWNNHRERIVSSLVTVIVGAIIPAVAFLKSGINSWGFPDAPLFIEQGYAISQGMQYMRSNPSELQYPFGLPAIISIGYRISEENAVAVSRIILLLFHFLTVLVVFLILNNLKINKKIQYVAIIGFSLDPFVLKQALDLQTEPMTALFISILCLIFLIKLDSPVKYRCIPFFYFFLAFLMIVTRPNLIVPIFGISSILIYRWRRDDVPSRIIMSASASFLFYLAAFHVFLSSVFKQFVPISGNSGQNLALACRSEFLPQYLGYADSQENQLINAWYFGYLNNIKELFTNLNPLASAIDLNREYQRVGIQNCLDNPIETMILFLIKSISLWRPSTVFGAYGIEVFVASVIFWVPLTILVLRFLFSRDLTPAQSSFRLFLIVFWGLFTISLIPSATQIRHRIAVAEQFYWVILAIYLNKKLVRL